MSSSDEVVLTHGKAKDVSCRIKKFGATVVSWKVDGEENIFVSKQAKLDGSKAIRGGIPVCFPSFGPWQFGPQHGFARNSKEWEVEKGPTVDERTGDVTVVLALADSEDTRKTWDHKFKFTYTITLTTRALKLEVDIKNLNDSKDLDFTFALHTYFSVPSVNNVEISDLTGLTYVDKTDDAKEKVEAAELVKVDRFTDRVYRDAPDSCVIKGLAGGRALTLTKSNMVDFVVWNPWEENAKKLNDFGDEEYKEMVCVEAVQTSKSIVVSPGQAYKAVHTMAVKD